MVRKLPSVLMIGLVVMCVARIPFNLDARFSFQMAAECGVMLVFAWCLGKQVNQWAGLLFALMVVSSAVNYDLFSYLTCRTALIGFVWYWIVAKNYNGSIMDGICIIALCNVAMLVLQALNMDPLYSAVDGGKDQMVGLMANPNEVSALLAVCMPAFLRPKRWWGLVLVLAGLIMAKSCGGVVAAAAGISVFLILRGDKFLGAALPVAGVLAYLLIDTPAVNQRVAAWTVGMEMYLDRWAFGYGLGHWALEFIKATDPRLGGAIWKYAHNEFLQGLFDMGPLFLIFLGGYIVNTVRRVRKLAKVMPNRVMESLHPYLSGAVVVFVNAGVNFIMHIGSTAILSVTLLGGLEYKLRELEAA